MIDEELEDIAPIEIASAYQLLCGAVLAQAISALQKRYIRRKEQIKDKRTARRWVEAIDCGVITLRDVCTVLGIDEERTRAAICAHADSPEERTISRSVLGVLYNADQ